MEKAQINPWTWQERAGFSQAWTVAGAHQVIFISTAVEVNGLELPGMMIEVEAIAVL